MSEKTMIILAGILGIGYIVLKKKQAAIPVQVAPTAIPEIPTTIPLEEVKLSDIYNSRQLIEMYKRNEIEINSSEIYLNNIKYKGDIESFSLLMSYIQQIINIENNSYNNLVKYDPFQNDTNIIVNLNNLIDKIVLYKVIN